MHFPKIWRNQPNSLKLFLWIIYIRSVVNIHYILKASECFKILNYCTELHEISLSLPLTKAWQIILLWKTNWHKKVFLVLFCLKNTLNNSQHKMWASISWTISIWNDVKLQRVNSTIRQLLRVGLPALQHTCKGTSMLYNQAHHF